MKVLYDGKVYKVINVYEGNFLIRLQTSGTGHNGEICPNSRTLIKSLGLPLDNSYWWVSKSECKILPEKNILLEDL